MTKEINDSWNEFMSSLCETNDETIESQINHPILDLFDKQSHIDRAKKNLFKNEFNKLLKLYLSRIAIQDLESKIKTHKEIFVRGFGRDRFNHLKLLSSLKLLEETKKPRRGLLAI